MRWLTRFSLVFLLFAASTAAFVFFIDSSHEILAIQQEINSKHWSITALRIGTLGLLAVSFLLVVYVRRFKNRDTASKKEFLNLTLRTIVWLVVLELLLGQSILSRTLEFLSG